MDYDSTETPLNHAVPVTADGHTFLPGDRIGVVGMTQETVIETCPGPNSGVITYDHSSDSTQFRMENELAALLNTDHYHWRMLSSARTAGAEQADDVFQLFVVEFPHTASPGDFSFAFGRGDIATSDDVSEVGTRDAGRTVARATPVDVDSWTTFAKFTDLVDELFAFDSTGRLDLAEFEDNENVTATINQLVCEAEEVVEERFNLQFSDEVDVEVEQI